MICVTKQHVFGVCDQVRHKPACSVTENNQSLEILDLASLCIVVSRQWTTKDDQIARMPRLIFVFVVRIRNKSGFLMTRLFVPPTKNFDGIKNNYGKT